MLSVLLVQFFWASFVAIGLATTLLLQAKRFGAGLYAFVSRSHAFIGFVVCFAVGVALFVVPVALGYILQWPIWLFEVLYVSVLVGAVYVLWVQRNSLKPFLAFQLPRSRKAWFYAGLPVLLIVAEYIMALTTGARLDDDTPLHIAHMQLMSSLGHLTLADPYMGYNGVLDLRYSTNILNALQVVAAHIIHIPAYKVWIYSYGVYRLLLCLSIFALGKVFLGKRVPTQWLYYLVILLPFFNYSYFFDYTELPHAIALVWGSLLFIGLKLLFEKQTASVFLVAALLIGATHSIASAYTVAFLGLLIILLLIAKSISRQQVLLLLAVISLLLIPVIANNIMPSHVGALQALDKSGHGLHPFDVYINKFGPIVLPIAPIIDLGKNFIATPQPASYAIDIVAIGAAVLLAGYVVLLKRLKSSRAKKVSLLLITTAMLGVYNVLYFSTVTYIYLLRNTKVKPVRLMVLLAIIFFALIAYNPVVLTAAYGRLPLLVLARFEELNTFMYIAPILGIFLVYRWIAKYWKIPEMAAGGMLFVLLLLAGWVLFRFPLNTARMATFDASTRRQDRYEYAQVDKVVPLSPYISGQVMYTNDGNVNYMGPVVATKQVGEIANYQSNQTNNLGQRLKCNKELELHLNLADLRAAHVTRVVIRSGAGLTRVQKEVAKLAASKTYITPIFKTDNYLVYNVNQATQVSTLHSVCAIPYGE